MSPHWVRWFLLAAASVVPAAYASPVPEVHASDYRPVHRSTLVSRPEPAFVQAKVRQGAKWATVLARRYAASDPIPMAIVRYADGRNASFVSVQLLPDPNDPTLNALALEHLYALMLRHDALDRYCLTIGFSECDASRLGVSHDALLLALAAARRSAASTPEMSPWLSISMRSVASATKDADNVAVQVFKKSEPMSGVTVYFNRAPHSGCAATTNANGVAACRLVDQHGDDGDHAEEANSRVIVTYPGEVHPEIVLLPTTYVLPPRAN